MFCQTDSQSLFFIRPLNVFTLVHFRTSKVSQADLGAVEDSADFFLAKTIASMEEKMNDTVIHESVEDDHDAGDNVGSGNLYIILNPT